MSMSPYDDISIKLESLSDRYDAAILSIGAVAFDRSTGKLGPEFYQEITIDSAIRSGHVLGSKLSWWMRQSDPAKTPFSEDQSLKLDLASTLANFATFYRGCGTGAAKVWGNGPLSDLSALENGFTRGSVGLSIPWALPNVRDMQTIVDAAGIVPDSVPFDGVKHNAVADAKHQARVIHAALRKLGAGVKLLPSDLARAHSKSSEEAAKLFAQYGSPKKPAPAVVDDDDEL